MARLDELKRRERDLQEEIYQLGGTRSNEMEELLNQLRDVQAEIAVINEQEGA